MQPMPRSDRIKRWSLDLRQDNGLPAAIAGCCSGESSGLQADCHPCTAVWGVGRGRGKWTVGMCCREIKRGAVTGFSSLKHTSVDFDQVGRGVSAHPGTTFISLHLLNQGDFETELSISLLVEFASLDERCLLHYQQLCKEDKACTYAVTHFYCPICQENGFSFLHCEIKLSFIMI